ncbi:Bax inhibitor-1/YccA family membrane protein [Coralloluteibacterium thermophilus]|uniref:Bax inhibitor-1/YccA family protein n=1 Tax=Coralloluteibacterium thermophilum TaxID=2707049 RepID=A0ABV9NJX4_9GAMM
MRSGNPTLNENTFLDIGTGAVVGRDGAMTINGTVNRTALLLIVTLVAAMFTWSRFFASGDPASVMPFVWGGAIGGLVVALVTVFKKTAAPFTGPLYAVLQGLFIGGISAMFEARFPGLVIQAVGLTFGVLAAMLVAYRTGLIRATAKFRMGVVAATGGIFVLYLVNMVMHFFGTGIPFIHESGMLGIGFSLFVVTIAALNLVLDFDAIESGVAAGAPKYMEWYGAFSLLVTLVWLYLEILRLLAKTRD